MAQNTYPTLFIGIGSSGAKILNHLQQLIYEEYLTPSLPVTKLLALVTLMSDTTDLNAQGVQPVYISVPKTETVRTKIDHPLTAYDTALKEWLPRRVLTFGGFTSGSNNVRAAGKLHLWENYSALQQCITGAMAVCHTGDAIDRSDVIINKRLTGQDGVHPPASYIYNQAPKVYVVGTLAGGTCSGMAADLGYCLHAWGAAGVYGVFTILSSAQAAQPANYMLAANCYAALQELDYHYLDTRTQSFKLPTANDIELAASPYDRIHLLEVSTMGGNTLMKPGRNVEFDHEGLMQVIAQNLFLQACAGTSAEMEGFYGDIMAVGGGGNSLRKRDTLPNGRRPRAYCSFGTATIAYPKYRVAAAAACQVAQGVVKAWLDTTRYDLVLTKGAAEADASQLVSSFTALAISPQGQKLEQIVKERVKKAGWIYAKSAQGIGQALPTFDSRSNDTPPHKTILEDLLDGGAYYTFVQQNYNKLGPKSEIVVAQYYRTLRNQPWTNVPGAQSYLDQLSNQLASRKAVLEKRDKDGMKLSNLDSEFTRLKNLEHDWATMILGLRGRALHERKEYVIELFEKEVQKEIKRLLARFEINLIDQLIGEKGAIVQLKQKLDAVAANLKASYDPATNMGALERRYDDLLTSMQAPPRNTLYVFTAQNAAAEIASNVTLIRDVGSGLILTMTAAEYDEQIRGVTPEALANKLTEPLLSYIIVGMNRVDAREVASRNWNAQYNNLINYAEPYVEVNSAYQGAQRLVVTGGHGRRQLFTSGTEAELDTLIRDHLPAPIGLVDNIVVWQPRPYSNLDHQVVFLCEEPCFSSTFLVAKTACKAAFDAELGIGVNNDFWTDERWVAAGGPPIEVIDRLNCIRFLMEQAYTYYYGDPENGRPTNPDLFGSHDGVTGRGAYFYSYPKQGGIAIIITIGDESSYVNAAGDPDAVLTIAALRARIALQAQNMTAAMFQQRGTVLNAAWQANRAGRVQAQSWEPADEADLAKKTQELVAFRAFVNKVVFHMGNAAAQAADNVALQQYPWLEG